MLDVGEIKMIWFNFYILRVYILVGKDRLKCIIVVCFVCFLFFWEKDFNFFLGKLFVFDL